MLQWHLENLNKGRIVLFQALNVVRETDPVTKREQLKKMKKNRMNYTKGSRSFLENKSFILHYDLHSYVVCLHT